MLISPCILYHVLYTTYMISRAGIREIQHLIVQLLHANNVVVPPVVTSSDPDDSSDHNNDNNCIHSASTVETVESLIEEVENSLVSIEEEETTATA